MGRKHKNGKCVIKIEILGNGAGYWVVKNEFDGFNILVRNIFFVWVSGVGGKGKGSGFGLKHPHWDKNDCMLLGFLWGIWGLGVWSMEFGGGMGEVEI